MFVRNAWYVASFAREVTHEIRATRILGTPLILWRAEDGELVAMEDSCPHRRVPLSIASLAGDEVRCGYHGMQFDRSGRCTKVPGQARAHPTARVLTFPAVERHSLMWVWLGAAELADPSLVPNLHWLQDPSWVAVTGYKHIKADYRLATDNLLDLSHETYVHAHTIGNAAVADNPVTVDIIADRVVRAHREMPSHVPPPWIAQTVGTTENINRWQTAMYMPPGVNMTEAGIYPISKPREAASVTRVLHLLTPETDGSVHYFWGMCRNYRLDDPNIGELISRGINQTFDEDKAILELQAARLLEEGNPAVPAAAIKVDEAPVKGRRLLSAMLEREQANAGWIAPPILMARDEVVVAA